MSDMSAKNPGSSIPARTVPVTISLEVQAFLTRSLTISPPEIDHREKDRLRAYITQVESQIMKIAALRAERFPAEIAEHSLTPGSSRSCLTAIRKPIMTRS